MTKKQYHAALRKLGLTVAGKATAHALGLTVRQCQRLAAGNRISGPLSRLLAMYLRHGIPQEFRG